MEEAKTKWIRRAAALLCIAAVTVFLAVMPMLAAQPQRDGPKAGILSGTARYGQLNTELIGGGVLAEEAAVTVTVPAAVKLTGFLVYDGVAVTEGTPLATVDRVTVMEAISQVQQTLDHLAEQIEKAGAAQSGETVTARAGGTVKLLYAREGDTVRSVMLEHGALAVLSLDDLLAVDIFTDSDLRTGTQVTVSFADGRTAVGRVAKNLSSVMTVTVEDQGYDLGETVGVTTSNGVYLGSDRLYIYSPWNVTAYTGTVRSIEVSVGDRLGAGKVLMVLSDVASTLEYRQLVSLRQEYEALMLELLQMYQTERLTAPCAGIVSGIDEDSPQLLSGSGGAQQQQTESGLYSLETVPVAEVTPQSTVTLQIAVDELDIRALQVGMEAQVTVNALGGEQYTATVAAIGNTGTNNGGSSKYPVTLTMDRAERMRAGMKATATVVLSTLDGVLTVPAAALVEQGNRTLIYTGYDAEKETLLEPVAVTVGSSDGETVELLDGLSEGQTYYYAYYDAPEIS